jgi:hypothetical protein
MAAAPGFRQGTFDDALSGVADAAGREIERLDEHDVSSLTRAG